MKLKRFLKLLEIPDGSKTIILIMNNTVLILLTLVIFDFLGVVLTTNMNRAFYLWTIIAVLWPSIDFFSNSMQLYINRKHNKNEEYEQEKLMKMLLTPTTKKEE